MATIFSRLISGELPSYKIYENERVFACLALDQISPGHTLVIPKIEVDHYMDVPDAELKEIFGVGKNIARAIKQGFGCKRVGLMVQGFEVPHFHVHLVPINLPGELDFAKAQRLVPEQMVNIHKKLVEALKGIL